VKANHFVACDEDRDDNAGTAIPEVFRQLRVRRL